MNAKMHCLVAAISLLALGHVAAQEPRRGDVQTRTVMTIALSVSSTGKEAKRVVYSPPPGWFILSHTIACTKKQGFASFSVTTVPAQWSSSSEEAKSDSAKALGDAEVEVPVVPSAKGKVSGAKESTASDKKTQAFSHHALVVDALAQGGGLLRSGAAIEMTVTAELVFLGKE